MKLFLVFALVLGSLSVSAMTLKCFDSKNGVHINISNDNESLRFNAKLSIQLFTEEVTFANFKSVNLSESKISLVAAIVASASNQMGKFQLIVTDEQNSGNYYGSLEYKLPKSKRMLSMVSCSKI